MTAEDATTPGPPLTPADAWWITITRAAERQFSAAHPDATEVDRQLREFVADMIADGKVRRNGTHWTFFKEGFYATISGDLRALIAYRTEHKYRTWAQVKAGVPSPLEGGRRNRRRRNRAVRHLAELAQAATDEGGQVVHKEDGEEVAITGPKGTADVHWQHVAGPRAVRANCYADLADVTGLTGLAELCPVADADDDAADASWLAVE